MNRVARIQKLSELRGRETQQAQVALALALRGEQAARRDEEECRGRLLTAHGQRSELARATSEAADYIAHEEWMDTLARKHLVARQALNQAGVEVQRAQAVVAQALTRHKQIETLLVKLKEQQRLEQSRRERRTDDELGHLLGLRRNGSKT